MISQGRLKETVFAQIGYSDYRPQNYEFIDFLPKDKFEEKIEECSLLITHSGVSSIISGLNKNKPIIVYPRLKKYKEHVDDHQLEIAKSFADLNYVLVWGRRQSL